MSNPMFGDQNRFRMNSQPGFQQSQSFSMSGADDGMMVFPATSGEGGMPGSNGSMNIGTVNIYNQYQLGGGDAYIGSMPMAPGVDNTGYNPGGAMNPTGGAGNTGYPGTTAPTNMGGYMPNTGGSVFGGVGGAMNQPCISGEVLNCMAQITKMMGLVMTNLLEVVKMLAGNVGRSAVDAGKDATGTGGKSGADSSSKSGDNKKADETDKTDKSDESDDAEESDEAVDANLPENMKELAGESGSLRKILVDCDQEGATVDYLRGITKQEGDDWKAAQEKSDKDFTDIINKKLKDADNEATVKSVETSGNTRKVTLSDGGVMNFEFNPDPTQNNAYVWNLVDFTEKDAKEPSVKYDLNKVYDGVTSSNISTDKVLSATAGKFHTVGATDDKETLKAHFDDLKYSFGELSSVDTATFEDKHQEMAASFAGKDGKPLTLTYTRADAESEWTLMRYQVEGQDAVNLSADDIKNHKPVTTAQIRASLEFLNENFDKLQEAAYDGSKKNDILDRYELQTLAAQSTLDKAGLKDKAPEGFSEVVRQLAENEEALTFASTGESMNGVSKADLTKLTELSKNDDTVDSGEALAKKLLDQNADNIRTGLRNNERTKSSFETALGSDAFDLSKFKSYISEKRDATAYASETQKAAYDASSDKSWQDADAGSLGVTAGSPTDKTTTETSSQSTSKGNSDIKALQAALEFMKNEDNFKSLDRSKGDKGNISKADIDEYIKSSQSAIDPKVLKGLQLLKANLYSFSRIDPVFDYNGNHYVQKADLDKLGEMLSSATDGDQLFKEIRKLPHNTTINDISYTPVTDEQVNSSVMDSDKNIKNADVRSMHLALSWLLKSDERSNWSMDDVKKYTDKYGGVIPEELKNGLNLIQAHPEIRFIISNSKFSPESLEAVKTQIDTKKDITLDQIT